MSMGTGKVEESMLGRKCNRGCGLHFYELSTPASAFVGKHIYMPCFHTNIYFPARNHLFFLPKSPSLLAYNLIF